MIFLIKPLYLVLTYGLVDVTYAMIFLFLVNLLIFCRQAPRRVLAAKESD